MSLNSLPGFTMGYKATIRALEAAQRKQERESQRRLRELERQSKEQAKLSELERARLDVETYESQLEALLTVHRQCGTSWDWPALAAALPAPPPLRRAFNELRARGEFALLTKEKREDINGAIAQAHLRDEQEFEKATEQYLEGKAEWEKLTGLAQRILRGEHKAYTEALAELSPFAEISDLGSEIHFTVHSAELIECVLRVNGKRAIPSEVRSLTASGKLSVKAMPKGRFHEVYQDYVSGCLLRVAREMFALIPIKVLLVTAVVDMADLRTGRSSDQPVLSAVMPRHTVLGLDFEKLDPSDAMDNFLHRGDFKASRKSEAFQPIIPLQVTDVQAKRVEDMRLHELLTRALAMHKELASQIAALRLKSVTAEGPQNS